MRASLLLWALLACLVLVWLGACQSPRKARAAPFAAEIERLNRELERRFQAGDMLGIADLYADDALLLGPDGFRVEGREAIDDYWSQFADPLDWKLEIFEIGGSEQMAYELGRSHLTLERAGDGASGRHTSVVDFVVLWKRDATGAWKIALDAYWPPPAPR